LEREQFLDKYDAKLVEQYGIVQKEYVVVPNSLLKEINRLKPFLLVSFNYTSSLKPKASPKKKSPILKNKSNQPKGFNFERSDKNSLLA
jgi:hypothetical protein